MNVRKSAGWARILAWIMLIVGVCFCSQVHMVSAADAKFNYRGINERSFPAKSIKIDTTEYYKYDEYPIFGSTGELGKCLFIKNNHIRFVVSFETIDGITDYGTVDTSGTYLTYSPSKDVSGKTVKFSLKQIIKSGSSEKETVYSYLFTVKIASSEPEKSGNNSLSALRYSIGGAETAIELTDETTYEVPFPAETEEGTLLTVLAAAADEKAKALIVYPAEEEALSLSRTAQTVKISVTAENGSVKEYTVSFRIKEEDRMPSVRLDGEEISDSMTILRDQNDILQFTVDLGAEDQKAEHFVSKADIFADHNKGAVVQAKPDEYRVSQRGGSSIQFSFYKEEESAPFYMVTINVVTRASYAKLEKVLEGDRVKGLKLENYTDESVSKLKTLLEQAHSIDRNMTYLQEGTIDKLSAAIYQAASPDQLELRKADYSRVDEIIRNFEAEREFYTAESAARVQEVLEEHLNRGYTILDQIFVDEYQKKLETAVKTLIDLPADYSEYEAALKDIPSDSEKYTDESFAALTKACENIRMNLPKRKQAELDRQVDALRKALGGLKLRFFPVDCTELEAVMRLIPKNLSGYTDESVRELDTILENLGSDYARWESSRQSEIDGFAERILGAVAGLIKKEVKPAPGEKSPETVVQPPQEIFPVSGWREEKGTLVYYRGGKKQTGWIRAKGHWYYTGTDGVQRRGWVKEGNVWYYLSPESGKMHINCISDLDGKTYAFDEGGGMLTDRWLKIENNWYYFFGNGAMKKNGWALIGGKWYYFYPDGRMAADVLTPDGEMLGKDGAWIQK